MVKLRNAGYCNLKLFLIYLVLYGHWIENQTGTSNLICFQYRLIYFFHMPLFVFLSGLFLQNAADCLRQIKRLLPLYLILQPVASLLVYGKITLTTPWWHLWYLLSYCCWAFFGWLWFHFQKRAFGWLILAAAILFGVVSGCLPFLDRTFSLSRTVVFFPYFFLGLLFRPNADFTKYRPATLIAFLSALELLRRFGSRIPTSFLYQAAPYGTLEQGFFLRLLCYAIGIAFIFFLLAYTPQKRFPFSKAGADTLPAYLIHAPFVLVFRKVPLPWFLCALLSGVFLYYLYKLLQWDNSLFGIISTERRANPWRSSRKSTNNTANPSTGTFSP